MESITVIFATHNRADGLSETLECFGNLDRTGSDVQIVVVCNACTDASDEVVRRYQESLPLVCLDEPSPGKNRALNKALREVELGDLVVFTDDDVSPPVNWLHQIVLASRRHPDREVFGGRIVPRWPAGKRPEWAASPWVLSSSFASHDLGIGEGPYPEGAYPFGGNFWVRKCVIGSGRKYSERIGPKGNTRIMGSETSFLMVLAKEGYRFVYCPDVVLEHRLKPRDVKMKTLWRRALSQGRGAAHLRGINYHNLLHTNRPKWYIREVLKGIKFVGALAGTLFVFPKAKRIEKQLQGLVDIGRTLEALKIAPLKRSHSEL